MERKKLVVTAIILIVVLIVIFLPGFSENQKLREQNEQLERRMKLLEQYNDKLREELSMMAEDPTYVEKRAREKLGIVKKGEIIYKPSE